MTAPASEEKRPAPPCPVCNDRGWFDGVDTELGAGGEPIPVQVQIECAWCAYVSALRAALVEKAREIGERAEREALHRASIAQYVEDICALRAALAERNKWLDVIGSCAFMRLAWAEAGPISPENAARAVEEMSSQIETLRHALAERTRERNEVGRMAVLIALALEALEGVAADEKNDPMLAGDRYLQISRETFEKVRRALAAMDGEPR